MRDKDATTRGTAIPGLCILGLFLTGLTGLAMAIAAAVANHFTGAGLCLLASAVAFGAVLHAAFS